MTPQTQTPLSLQKFKPLRIEHGWLEKFLDDAPKDGLGAPAMNADTYVTHWLKRENNEKLPNIQYSDKTPRIMASIKIDDILGCADFEKKLKDKLLADFRKHGVPETPSTVSMAAYTAHVTVMEKCREEWAKIPTYRDAKARGESSSPLEHFDTYWRLYLNGGLLFQHIISEYDDGILSDMRGFLKRRQNIDSLDYKVPTLRDYNDHLLKIIDIDLSRRMATPYHILSRR